MVDGNIGSEALQQQFSFHVLTNLSYSINNKTFTESGMFN